MENTMRYSRIAALTAITALLAACQTSQPQGALYSAGQVNRPMAVTACTVTSVRSVAVQDGSSDTASQIVGGVAGALVGRAVGRNIGGGSGQKLARDLGTIGGAVAGASAGSAIHSNTSVSQALEYTVRTSNGSMVVVQKVNAGEPVLPAGSRCSVVGNGSSARVSPA